MSKTNQGRRRRDTKTVALEITTMWSETRLDVRQLGDDRRARRITLGNTTGCDIHMTPDELAGASRFALVEVSGETARINIPPGASIELDGGDEQLRREIQNINQGGSNGSSRLSLPIQRGWKATVEIGSLSFRLEPVQVERLELPWRRPDWRSASLMAASVLAHAAFLAVAFMIPPEPRRVSLDMVAEDNRFNRLIVSPPELQESSVDDWVAAGSSGEEGLMGRTDARRSDNRFGIRGPADQPDPHMARDRVLGQAGSSGVLSALGSHSPTSPFGGGSAAGNDPSNALGRLMGDRVGDSFGHGGLGLRGTGRGGGGGRAGTIGLGALNTIGHGGGGGSGSGYGRGRGSRPGAPPSRAMASNGVLASNFVGGHGVEARLSDLLDRGVMVDGENVRIEAFQDRGPLPYPVPTDEAVALYAELERSRVVAEGDRVHLQVALMGRRGELPERPRMDVRLVLDRSGSMHGGGKWENAVSSVHALVDQLRPGDIFGLITYAGHAELALSPRQVRSTSQLHRQIDEALAADPPGGGTNISSALNLANEHRPQRRRPNDLGLVVLISDGMANGGLTNPRELAAISRRMFDEGGVLTTTIGLGTDFDESIMLSVAREGNGSYHFVRRPSDITSIMEDELQQRAQAVAQALRVRVVLEDGVEVRRVYGSRMLNDEEHAAVRATEVAIDQRLAAELGIVRDRRREAEEGLRIHLGTFRRGDQHVILMELDVPPGQVGSEAAVARVFLDYKDLSDRSNQRVERSVTADRVNERSEALASLRRPVKRTALAFQAGEALQQAAEALETGRIPEARQLLAERRELLEAAAELWRDPSLRQDAQLISRYETVLSRAYPGWNHQDQRTLVLAMNYFGDQRMR